MKVHRCWLLTLVLAGPAAAFACGGTVTIGTVESDASTSTGSESSSPAAPACESSSAEARTLDPSGYDRSCTSDTDCIAVLPVSASTEPGKCEIGCCNAVAVRNTASLTSDRARLQAACCLNEICLKECSQMTGCVQGQCAVVLPSSGSDGGTDATSADAASD